MEMVKICVGDVDLLVNEGWEVGSYWSNRVNGTSGYWLRHPEHHEAWMRARTTPCSEDSLQDDEGFVGPYGPVDSATEALLDRISREK